MQTQLQFDCLLDPITLETVRLSFFYSYNEVTLIEEYSKERSEDNCLTTVENYSPVAILDMVDLADATNFVNEELDIIDIALEVEAATLVYISVVG